MAGTIGTFGLSGPSSKCNQLWKKAQHSLTEGQCSSSNPLAFVVAPGSTILPKDLFELPQHIATKLIWALFCLTDISCKALFLTGKAFSAFSKHTTSIISCNHYHTVQAYQKLVIHYIPLKFSGCHVAGTAWVKVTTMAKTQGEALYTWVVSS